MPTELIAPIVAGVLALAGVIASAIINKRTQRGMVDASHEPTAVEAWAETERARKMAHFWEDLFYLLRGIFKGYARRMYDLFGEDKAALNTKERSVLETEPAPPTTK